MDYSEAAYRLDQLVQNPDIEVLIHKISDNWWVNITGKQKEPGSYITATELKTTGKAPVLLEAIDVALARWHQITAGVPELRMQVIEYHPLEPMSERAGPPTPRKDLDDDIPF